MKLYALYYYDRAFLSAFLNHYCRFHAVDEMVIQDQNWSVEDSRHLQATVAHYRDEFHKKIGVRPSQFQRVGSDRDQLRRYGIPGILNSLVQSLQGNVCIWGSMDEAMYGDSYEETEKELQEVERTMSAMDVAVGYLLWSNVGTDGIHPIDWRARIWKSIYPVQHRGRPIHDNSLDAFIKGEWRRIMPVSTPQTSLAEDPYAVKLKMKLLHYRPLIRVQNIPRRSDVEGLEKHPHHYVEKLPLK